MAKFARSCSSLSSLDVTPPRPQSLLARRCARLPRASAMDLSASLSSVDVGLHGTLDLSDLEHPALRTPRAGERCVQTSTGSEKDPRSSNPRVPAPLTVYAVLFRSLCPCRLMAGCGGVFRAPLGHLPPGAARPHRTPSLASSFPTSVRPAGSWCPRTSLSHTTAW